MKPASRKESDPNGDWWELFDENHKVRFYIVEWSRVSSYVIFDSIHEVESELN